MPKLPSALAQAESWLSSNPFPPDEPGALCINLHLMKAARAFARRGLSERKAYELIEANMTRQQKHPREIERAVRKAYGTRLAFDGKPVTPIEPFDIERLARVASNVHFEVSDDWLAEVSPECVLDVSPANYLQALYEPGESVCIVTDRKARKTAMWQYGDPSDSLDWLKTGHEGVWYLTHPVLGTEVNGSWRSEANVSSWRYGIIETDDAPDELWRKLLVQLRLPIAAIYESGKRGCHALIRYDAESKAQFDAAAADLKRQLVPFGACPGVFRAAGLSRLPGCMRGETGQLQKLLYLNPEPEQRAIREPR